MTCYEMLLKTCDKKKGVIVFNKHKLPMTKFLKDIDKFAFALKKLGFEKGEVLTIYLPTCPQSLVAFYACSKLGIVANIVHPLLPTENLIENLKETNSKGLLFYDLITKNFEKIKECNQILIKCSVKDYVCFRKPIYDIFLRLKNKTFKEAKSYSKLITFEKGEEYGCDIDGKEDEVVCTMHSGGTSGKPKIVKLTNFALNELSVNLEKMYTRKNRVAEYGLVALPMFHAYGLGVAVHTCLTNGYSLVLVPKFDPRELNECIKKYNVTFFAGVPVMFKKMMECSNFRGKHLGKLRDLWCGGDVLNETFVEHFDTVLEHYDCPARIMRGYGLTEVGSVCTTNTFDYYKKNSCGRGIPNTIIEVWDDDNNKLNPNTIGEIVVYSPSVMKGYLDDSGYVIKDGKKWVKTGDIGYVDEDDFLFILDRKKRSIKINAINVFPSEIENLVKTLDFIDEACAVPYHYDEKIYIKLYITLAKDVNLEEITENKIKKDITKLCEKNLIKYAVPKVIEIIKEMPRTNLGKVDFKKFDIIK